MRELNAILEAWRESPQASGVLATVVHVEGSAYRRPGARMLIRSDGSRVGTISGGCLEGDVARKAGWWTAGGDPVLRVYDTMSDDDAVWEFGLGCRGRIHVLLEPVATPGARALLEHLSNSQEARQETVVATVVRAASDSTYRTGEHLFEFPLEIAAEARETLAGKCSRLLHLPYADIFLEYFGPTQRLVIFGAGHDAIPLVTVAAMLGWSVTVADVRSGYAKPERFPGAGCVAVLPPSGDASSIAINHDTAVVFMTHNLGLDIRLLPQVMALRPRYFGLLGPWKRTELLFEEAGLAPHGANLHAPIGLDLGGDSAEAIAIAIVAEIQATLAGRTGGSMRWRNDPIHSPVYEIGESGALAGGSIAAATCEVMNG